MALLPLVQTYKSILESLNVSFDDNGLATFVTEDGSMPVMVDGRRLVLPIHEVLRNSPWDTLIPFHPLSEDIMLGESPVLKKLKAMVNLRITSIVSILLSELVDLAADVDGHKKLTAKQKEFLKSVPDVDEKTVKVLENVLKQISISGKNRLVNIYLRRGPKLGEKTYQRAAIVSFPILDEFEFMETVVSNDDGSTRKVYKIFDVTMRKRDKETLEMLIKWVLIDGNLQTKYSAGSNSLSAPYFDALIRAFVNVVRQTNYVADMFKKQISAYDQVKVDLDWVDSFIDLDQYRHTLPTPLPGNEGSGAKDEPLPEPTIVSAPRAPKPYTATETPPTVPFPVAPISAAVSSVVNPQRVDDGSDWLATVVTRNSVQTTAPFAHLVGAGVQTQPPVAYPAYGQPYYQPQATPAPFAHLVNNQTQQYGGYQQQPQQVQPPMYGGSI